MAVFVNKILIRDVAELAIQRVCDRRDVGSCTFAHDRAHRIDMLIDQCDRNTGTVRRMLKDTAQAFGGRRRERIPEGCCAALDVMGGTKQLFEMSLAESVLTDRVPGSVETVAFGCHPS